MSVKKISLFTILAVCSMLLGAILGLLDIFGFIDGRHTLSLSLLISAVGLVYVILVVAFLLNFAKENRIYLFFGLSTLLFGIPFFMMNLNPVLTLLSSILYLTFLVYVYSESLKRSQIFVKFSPRELFFPVLKSSFTFFMIVLAILAYTQSQKLVSQNSLVSPALIDLVSKPTVYMLNQQINTQLGSGISSEILSSIPDSQKEAVIQKALSESVKQMAGQNNDIYGIPQEDIPVQLATIREDNTVDITPVIQAMLPAIADRVNDLLSEYAVIAPLAVAVLTFIIVQPLIIPISLLESMITIVLFKILMSTGFIHISKEQREVEVPSL